jgi:membrane protease YdiL (CAAX protease family)
MYIVFLVLLVLIKLAPIAVELKEKKNHKKDVIVTEKMQCKYYAQQVTFLWSGVLAVFIMSLIGNINFYDIGFRPISFSYNIWFTIIILALSGLLLAYSLHNLILSLTSAKFQEEMKKHKDGAGGILPRSKKERLWFSLSSFSAGICEEILYRGFMVFLLQSVFPGIPLYLIILIPAVLFGIGHVNQGLSGVIATGILGTIFMCLFLVSGSLILPMLLHFLFDFSSTFLLSEKRSE